MKVCLHFLLALLSLGLNAQSFLDQPVSANFAGHRIDQILTSVGEQTGVDFYFDPNLLGTENYQVDFEEVPLRSILDGLLQDTDLGYAPYEGLRHHYRTERRPGF